MRHADSGVYGNLRFSLEQVIESDSWTPYETPMRLAPGSVPPSWLAGTGR
jgi:hypothetical protein